MDHRDAECLSANWNNRGVLRKSPYHVRNMCPDYGRVVAKVDLRSAMDRTLHLDDGDWRDGSTVHSIRGISCCSDSGDLCNRSDVLNDEGCLARFLQVSSAAATCENATARYSGERGTCTIAADCLWADPNRVVHPYKHTRILVPFPDLDEVRNCHGRFKPGPCGELRAHGLLTHQAKGFRQHGFAGKLSWDPVAGGRGPRLSLTRTLGFPGRSDAGTPFARGTLAGPDSNEPGIGFREPRLEARFGYGLPAFGGSFTSTPEIAVGLSDAGRDYSLGWRLMRGGGAPDGSALEIALEARRRESPSGRGTPPEHAVGVRVISLF